MAWPVPVAVRGVMPPATSHLMNVVAAAVALAASVRCCVATHTKLHRILGAGNVAGAGHDDAIEKPCGERCARREHGWAPIITVGVSIRPRIQWTGARRRCPTARPQRPSRVLGVERFAWRSCVNRGGQGARRRARLSEVRDASRGDATGVTGTVTRRVRSASTHPAKLEEHMVP